MRKEEMPKERERKMILWTGEWEAGRGRGSMAGLPRRRV